MKSTVERQNCKICRRRHKRLFSLIITISDDRSNLLGNNHLSMLRVSRISILNRSSIIKCTVKSVKKCVDGFYCSKSKIRCDILIYPCRITFIRVMLWHSLKRTIVVIRFTIACNQQSLSRDLIITKTFLSNLSLYFICHQTLLGIPFLCDVGFFLFARCDSKSKKSARRKPIINTQQTNACDLMSNESSSNAEEKNGRSISIRPINNNCSRKSSTSTNWSFGWRWYIATHLVNGCYVNDFG